MENYLNLLLEQLNKNRQINELAKRERDAIAVENIGIVMESNAIRKEIISQLTTLETEMDPYLGDLPKRLEDASPQLKDQVLTVSNDLYKVIEETITIDSENKIRLEELKKAISDKMREVKKGKKALRGYKNPSHREPKLFDGQI